MGVYELDIHNNEIKRLLIKTLNYQNLTPNDLPDNEPLLGSRLRIDSLDFFDLMAAVNETYGVAIKDEDIPSVRSIQDVTLYINQRLALNKTTP